MSQRDQVLDQAVATFKTGLEKYKPDCECDDDAIRCAMTDVIAEVRKSALQSLLDDTEALGGARHLMLWQDGYSRPTYKNLREHCRMLGHTPPDDCLDIDHVPPKELRIQWILKAIMKVHERFLAK